MSTIQFPPGGAAAIVSNTPFARVRIKDDITDTDEDWETVHYLEVLQCTRAIAPTLPRATLRWRAGNIHHEDVDTANNVLADANGFIEEKPRDLTDKWVMIEYLTEAPAAGINAVSKGAVPIWIGRIVETHSSIAGQTDNVEISDQEYTAYGIEHELKRIPIFGSFVTNDGTDVFKIDRPLIFNEKYTLGLSPIGNRSDNAVNLDDSGDDPKAHVFAQGDDNDPSSSVWSNLDILNYLLVYYWPYQDLPLSVGGVADDAKDSGGDVVNDTAGNAKDPGVLNNLKLPKIDLDGMNLYEAICRLVDRRRGLGWCIRFSVDDDDSVTFTLHVFTVFDSLIKTSDGQTIPPNKELRDIDQSTDLLQQQVKELLLKVDSIGDVGTIIVEGEQLLSCFTLSFADGTLEKGWSDGDEAGYLNGAGDSGTGPSSQDKNDQERRALKYLNVFCNFRVVRDWDWTAKNALGSGGSQICNPVVNDDGSIDPTKQSNARTWGNSFLRNLPFLEPAAVDELQQQFSRPMVWVKHPTTGVYLAAHNPGLQLKSCHLNFAETDLAFQMSYSPAHALASGHWSGAKSSRFDPTVAGNLAFDYTKIIATVSVRTDARLMVKRTIANRDPNRAIVIKATDAELWYVVPNTVIDVERGQLTRLNAKPAGAALDVIQQIDNAFAGSGPGNSILRDDSPVLRRLAAMAEVWYSKTRRSLSPFTTRAMQFGLPEGCLIGKINRANDSIEINTVLSEIEWDFQNGTTSLHSDFGEMDFTASREDLPSMKN